MKRVLLVVATVAGALALSSAGRAAGQDLPDAEAAKATTSEVCFDAALYEKGAKVDYDTRVTGDGATPPRRVVITVKKSDKFNGVSATPVLAKFYDDAGKPAGETTSFFDVKGGFLEFYGSTSDVVEQTVKPAARDLIKMRKGESFEQDTKITNTYPDGRKEKSEQTKRSTFQGIEKKKFSVGRFKACEFKSRITQKLTVGSPQSVVINRTDWVAAEGKYRGFTLKTKISASYSNGTTINQAIDVTKIRTFDVK